VDTHRRAPEEKDTLIYGEWVVYTHPYKGDVLATIQDFGLIKDNSLGSEAPYKYPDTSYKIVDGKARYNSFFKVKVQFTNASTGVGKVTMTQSNRVRPMTEEENRQLEIYLSNDLDKFPLIINAPLLKEVVRVALEKGKKHIPNSTFL
jgi:hypothetical protein